MAPGPHGSIACISPSCQRRAILQTFALLWACVVPMLGASHGNKLLLPVLLPCFIKTLPFTQKYPIRPLHKHLVSLLWRGFGFTVERSQAVNRDKAFLLPEADYKSSTSVFPGPDALLSSPRLRVLLQQDAAEHRLTDRTAQCITAPITQSYPWGCLQEHPGAARRLEVKAWNQSCMDRIGPYH